MPPPFPFKVFVLAASVFEMKFWHFLLAIFVGRLIRFLLLASLVLKFGPQIVAWGSEVLAKHWILLIVAVAGAIAVGFYTWAKMRK